MSARLFSECLVFPLTGWRFGPVLRAVRFVLAIAFFFLHVELIASQRAQTPASPLQTGARSTSTEDQNVERQMKEQPEERQRAREILDSLLDQIQSSSETFKIRAGTQVANILFEHNEKRALSLLEELFAAIKSVKPKDPLYAPASAPEFLRQEVLHQVVARDPDLAERLIQTVSEEDVQAVSESAASAVGESTRHLGQVQANEPSDLYMTLATSLTETDVSRAAEFVRRSLNQSLSGWLPGTLRSLRMKDANVADQLFADALSVAEKEAVESGFVGSVFLLGSYVFPQDSGFGSVTITRKDGTTHGIMLGSGADYTAPHELIKRFLDFCYPRLTQSLTLDQSSSASIGSFLGSGLEGRLCGISDVAVF